MLTIYLPQKGKTNYIHKHAHGALFFPLAVLHSLWDLFPDEGSNSGPMQWKQGVLTTGPPGNSHGVLFTVVLVAI